MCFFSNEMSLLYVPASAEISWTKSYILDAALWLWSYLSGCWQYSQGLVYTFKKIKFSLTTSDCQSCFLLTAVIIDFMDGWSAGWIERG